MFRTAIDVKYVNNFMEIGSANCRAFEIEENDAWSKVGAKDSMRTE